MADSTINGYQNPKYQQNPNLGAQPQTQAPVNPAPTAGNPNAVDNTPQSDTFNQNPAQAPESKNDQIVKAAGFLGSAVAINQIDKLYNKACGGDYDKTILAKFGRLGDKIAAKCSGNKTFDAAEAFYNTCKTKTVNFIEKTPLLKSIVHTPTKPECSMVTGFLETQRQSDLSEAAKNIKEYVQKLPKSLKDAGATKAEIDALKAKYGVNMFGQIKNSTQAIEEFQFFKLRPDLIGKKVTPEGISKSLKYMKMHHLGFVGRTFESELANTAANESKIIAACGKKVSPKLTQSMNKLSTELMHTTKLGKLFAKAPKVFMRGLTFGGGTLNSLMVAWGLGTAIYNTYKAPKKQKVGTAVAGGVDAVSWVVSMPIALKMMHGLNGMQYAGSGMDKAAVDAYRTALKAFNNKTFATEAEHAAELAKLMAMKAPKGKVGFFTKAMSKLAHVLSVGLELPKSFKVDTKTLTGTAKAAAKMGNLKRMLPNILKNCAGYPLRFALYMFVAQPIIDKLISSCTSAIFGKPYDPEAAKEKEAEKAKTAGQGGKFFVPADQRGTIKSDVNIANLPDANLIKQKLNGTVKPAGTTNPSQPTQTNPAAPVRTYIPQETPPNVPLNTNDHTPEIDDALSRSDKIMNNADKVLNHQFK